MLNIEHPAIIAEKIPPPLHFQVNHVGAADETVCYMVKAYSGSPAAQALAKENVSIGSMFGLPGNVGVLVLSKSEADIISEFAAIEEGKKLAIQNAAPLVQVHELSQITAAKTLLYQTYGRLYFCYGGPNFTRIF